MFGGRRWFANEYSRICDHMHNKSIKTFIYNNGGYLTIKQTQQLGFNSRIMDPTPIRNIISDYKKIAESHNIKYFKINNNKNLKKKI